MITTKKFTVPHMMTDRFGHLSMRNLAGLMFEVSFAQSQIAEKDIDMEKIRWIVYSWDLEVDDVIKVNDELEIGTFSMGMDRFYAYRNFYVKRDGVTIARAYVVFLLMDIERMRPIKASDEIKKAYGSEEEIFSPRKLTLRDDYGHRQKIQVRHTDIDSNFHVNNAAYFDYIYQMCGIDSKDIEYINIVYKNEIRNKDAVIGEYIEYDNQIDFRLVSTDDDTIYTYGKVVKNV